MNKKHDNRAALELSDGYWADAQDYIQRYKFTVESEVRNYWDNKSRRMKAYIDLRFAIETLLKSRICLSTGAGCSREDLLKELFSLGHKIGKLVHRSGWKLDPVITDALGKCDSAPVHWRYEVEARASRDEDERYYRATVGNDAWMRKLEGFAESEIKALGKELNEYSCIVSASLDDIEA